jgi:hypothetical protein
MTTMTTIMISDEGATATVVSVPYGIPHLVEDPHTHNTRAQEREKLTKPSTCSTVMMIVAKAPT